MKDKKIILVSLIVLILIFGSFIYFKQEREVLSFKIDTILLKSVIKQGETVSNSLKINNLNHEQNFNVYIKGLEDLVSLSENNFKLKQYETKEITVTFKDESLKEPGVYVGTLIIEAGSDKKEIPVILEIQTKELLFATNLDVGPEYKRIKPGDKFSIGIKLFNLKDTETHTIGITYLVRNLNSEIIVAETENIVVGTESLITKTIVLPENIALGNYVFAVTAKYDDSVSTSSYLFSVAKEKINMGLDMNYVATIILIFLFGILILVFYMIHERDKLFLELKKQHTKEIQTCFENIEEQKKKAISKVKKPKEKEKIIKRFDKIHKEVVRNITKKHKRQKTEFQKLKKQNKEDEIKKRLKQWKRQGFNVSELPIKTTTKPSKKEMKDTLKEWKKQGFDTSVLKKK